MTDLETRNPPYPPSRPIAHTHTPRRRPRDLRVLLTGLIATVCLIGLGSYGLWLAEPGYWKQWQRFAASHSSGELMDMAQSVEQRVLADISGVTFQNRPTTASTHHATPGPPGPPPPSAAPRSTAPRSAPPPEGGTQEASASPTPWQHSGSDTPAQVLSMSVNEINAWIAQRLDGWLKNQRITLPPGISQPMLAFKRDRLILAFRYQSPRINQVFSVVLQPNILEDGRIRITLDHLKAGRLNIPFASLTKHLKPHSQSPLYQLSRQLVSLNGKTIDPFLNLNRQQVRVRSFNLRPDGVDLAVSLVDNP